ncbi:MAG: hypothetical protein IJB15_11095 [Clostridia bacterium]|nr:hypothetical protein [Clostridia bacterium]
MTECAHFSPENLYDTLRNARTNAAAVVHVMPDAKYAGLQAGAADMPMEILFPADGDCYTIG